MKRSIFFILLSLSCSAFACDLKESGRQAATFLAERFPTEKFQNVLVMTTDTGSANGTVQFTYSATWKGALADGEIGSLTFTEKDKCRLRIGGYSASSLQMFRDANQ